MELNERIAAYVKAIDDKMVEYWKMMEFTHSPPPTHRADFISDKWVRVVVLELRNGTPTMCSVHSFVCLQDGFTKTLGTLKVGDIHKPASFKAPAKHARGTVFAEDYSKTLSPSGSVVSLK